MTADDPENEPRGKSDLDLHTADQASPERIDAQTIATTILTKCVSGDDVSGDFAKLAEISDGGNIMEYLATALAEHSSMLTTPQHWMTLSKGAEVESYITVLRIARRKMSGANRLIIATKLADTLRRKGDKVSLEDAEQILAEDIPTITDGERNGEELRALGSALYTRSFIPLGKKEKFGTGEELPALSASLDDLRKSAEYAREGGDEENAIQSEIRVCAVQLDHNYGDAAEILETLDCLVAKLQGAGSTWAKRFLKNALGRRVEAAAKSHDAQWGMYYGEYIALPGIEQHCGGKEAFDEWKAHYNPFLPREETESA